MEVLDRMTKGTGDLRQTGDAFVPPRDDVERRLAQIWTEVMGVPEVGIRDDFFSLGGNSLRAVRTLTEIHRAFGRLLPMRTLAESPTIERLATELRGESSSQSLVIPLQNAGNGFPFFCLSGVGGHVLILRELARLVGPDQPFYGIQYPGLDGSTAPLDRIETMAAFLIKEIRAVQASGPYHIGGYSAGGIVAYEIARQLREDGHDIGLLAMIDTRAPRHTRIQPFPVRLLLHFQEWRTLSGADRAQYLKDRYDSVARRLRRRFTGAPRAGVAEEEMWINIARFQEAMFEAIRSYAPRGGYDGELVIYTAASRTLWETRGLDQALGWRPLINGAVDIETLPGTHLQILSGRGVQVLAEKLRVRLRNSPDVRGYTNALGLVSSV